MIRAALAALAVALAAAPAHAGAGTPAARTATATTASAPAPAEMDLVDTPIGKRPRKPLPPYVPGPPDKAALADAEDANVESAGGRSGVMVAASLGPAILVGINKDHATGTGGGFSFRLGRVANRWTVFNLEICGVVFPYTTLDKKRKINQSAFATVGVQTWAAPSFWVRAAGGLAVFTNRTDMGVDRTATRIGGGVVLGAGAELVRRRSVSLALELLVNGALYRDGAIIGGGLGLSLGIY